MTAFALHLPDERSLSRWTLSGLAILLAHAAIIAAIALWYARQPVEPNIIPAISVSLAPVEASSPEMQTQDIAVGPTMQQAEEVPKEVLKEEKPVEKLELPPPPQPQAEVTLPREEPKQVEKPKPEVQPPAPETRAPRNTQIGTFTEAGSNAYNALVLGRLQRFVRYPKAGNGAVGKVGLRFVLNREGAVIGSEVTKSSGNRVLDLEALEIVRRASPLPPFPAAKPGAQDFYNWTVDFTR